MKKHLKTCLAILFSIVLAMNSVSVSALASDNENEQEMSTVDNGENYEEIQSEDSEDEQAIEVENPSTSGDEVGETEEASLEETGQETTKQEDAEDVITTEEIRTEETAVETTAVETTSEAITGENEEETTEEMTSEAITEESEESVNMPEFAGLKIVDGVVIMVTAPEGVFPEESTLLVNKVSNEEQQNVDNAVDKTRNNNVNVAASYTYDIKVLNKDGEEIQPADEQKVKVIFTLAEAENENLTADIYHITGENGELSAEALDTTGQGAVVMAESDGFSYYTVEFTYDEKQYVMEGDSSVALTDILSYVGITKADGNAATDSDITAVSVSDESLFSASNESGEWIVTAHQAFTSNEWMKVTVDGVEYEIVVTDAIYRTTTTYTASGWDDVYFVYDGAASYTINGGGMPVWNPDRSGGTNSWNATIAADGTLTFNGTSYGKLSSGNNAWHLYWDEYATSAWAQFGSLVWAQAYVAPPSWTVTYDKNSGSDDVSGLSSTTVTVDQGSSTTLPTLTRSGYTFNGWYTAASGGNKAGNGGASYTPTGNITLYAQWTLTPATAPTINSVRGATLTYGYTANSGSVSVSASPADGQHTITGYQWYSNTSNSNSGGSEISGATDTSYTIPAGMNAGDYYFYCVVSTKREDNDQTTTKASDVATVKVNKAEISITAKEQTKTYGSSIDTDIEQVTVTGLITGDSLDSITLTPSTSDATTNGTITPSAATIKKSDTNVTNNYSITYNTGALKINKKTITIASGITASDKTYDGTTNATLNYSGINWTSCGMKSGDTLSVTATGTFADANADDGKMVTITGLTLGGNSAGNYQLAASGNQSSTTANITTKAITITAASDTKIYDGTALTKNSHSITSGSLATGDSINSITVTGSQTDVGSSDNIVSAAVIKNGSNADVTANYNITYANGTLTVNKRAVTITADSDSKVYDGTTHTKNSYSITSGALAEGDTIESVTVTGSQKYVGLSDNIPSDAVIKNSSGVDVTSNYNITYTNGTVEVTKKPLTITADSDTKVYDNSPLTKNSYTHTALAEGDTIESVTVTGTQTFVGESENVPSAAVIKNGDDDMTANYDITYVNGTLEVTKKVVTITADDDTKVYDGTPLTKDSYTVSGLESGDRIDSVTITGSQIFAGTSNNVPSAAVIKNSANEDVNDNYTISYVNGTLEVTPKAVTITADSDTKVYDGTALVKDGYSITGGELATGDTIESVTVTGTQTIAGEGANVPSAAVIKNASDEDVTASYDITYENGTLEVTKKAVTITADSDTKVYDGTALIKDSYTNSDLVAGDSIESVTITGIQTDAGESANVPSEAVIKNVNGEDVTASYDINYENGTLEVNKKQVTISGISVIDKIYDGTTDAELNYSDIDWSACGMVDGDELSVTAKGTYEDTSVGEDKSVIITDITLGGRSADNYILSENGQQTTATATINKKAVIVTAIKQTVAVNGEIENSVDMAELTGAVEGHKLAEITLTSGSTEKTTTEGVITPSEAKIVDGDIDVTDNYDITYADGVMTVTKAEAEVVLDNGDDEASASVTAVEVPNLLELADEEAEEGKLVKVELSVKPVSENKVNAATVSDVKKTVESLFAFVDIESVKVEYLEIDLTKYVDNVKDSAISDTGTPLEIILTYDTSKAGNPVIIRKHEGTVKVFTQLSSRPAGSLTDATYYVEGDKIYMYSQYFSDFAIAYSVDKTFNVNLDDGNGNVTRQIVSEGAKFIPPADLAKDGYDFDGWYKDDTFTQKWNPDTDKVTSDIKLYAKWIKRAEPTKVDVPDTKVDVPDTKVDVPDTKVDVPDTKVDVPETKVDTPETKTDKPAEITVPDNTAKSPTTGDMTHTGVVFILMMLSALGVVCLRFIRKKI